VPNYAEDPSHGTESQAEQEPESTHPGREEEAVQEQANGNEWDEAEDERNSNDTTLWNRSVSKNIHTGQWAALGSLSYQFEDGKEDEEFEGEEEEAMAYLRAVR
jgi:hypothetical protein